MPIYDYIETLNRRYKSGISSEHSYRGDLESLIRQLASGVEITNEPAKVTDCGNPDYVITRGKIPVGYIEAKDIGKDLASKQYKEQFDRYKKALDNLIITDYLFFQFFQGGELIYEVRIGEIQDGAICPLPENFSQFVGLITDFCSFVGQTVKSSKKLAEMMASKARLLQNILEQAIIADEQNKESEDVSSLEAQYKTFKSILIHDLSPKAFADIYAQTLAYGMFAARLNDKTLEDFSRQEAAELIPKSNPFLRRLFEYIAGASIDERIVRTVDNLAAVFRATNVEQLLRNFGKSTQTSDPIIHFYETFLAAYDPKLRKARGVWYTPAPVVNFIVRFVDDILITDFDLQDGLANTEKTKIKTKVRWDKKEVEKEVHKVQILDPATGTGTFLAEVVKHLYTTRFQKMQGMWSKYVYEDLIPRLNGFELLMASYAMAHLKLDMLLRSTGYATKKERRFQIYLTNSLEEHHRDTGTLFSLLLSEEAEKANQIKRDIPVMCVIGNPPYSVSSSNKGEWIENLVKEYKKDLNEKNIQPLSDDYIKFIRYGQYYIQKNGKGVLAYISNNSFLDGIIHRQMRKNLLQTFDSMYIVDLHGNSKKKEIAPNGSKDENVFDIMQGVSINIFVKTGKKKKSQLARVFHYDLYGNRNAKYDFLHTNSIKSIPFTELPNKSPYYFFVPKDYEIEKNYKKGFKIDDLMPINTTGITTHRDNFTISYSKKELKEVIEDFLYLDDEDARKKFNLGKDVRDWKVTYAKEDLKNSYPNKGSFAKITYRPFDTRWTFYTGKSKGFMSYPRNEVMKHFINEKNIGLVLMRTQINTKIPNTYFVSNNIIDKNFYGFQTYTFPLYIYPNPETTLLQEQKRKPNLNLEIVSIMEKNLGLSFTPEKESHTDTFAPIDILDYIYAVLHSPAYREKYKEFLKIDFPRVPYPKNKAVFWKLVELGGKLRQIHLLESCEFNKSTVCYPIDGDNVITTSITKKDWELTDSEKSLGKIWINDKQYFENIPLVAWEFFIGGYQVAQKWLKDRKGKTLQFDDILHYQKIIAALTQTDFLMKEIDSVFGEN